MVEKEFIRERLNVAKGVATSDGSNLFSSNVPNRKVRYVVAIFASGGTTQPVTMSLSKIVNSTSTLLFGGIPVGMTALVQIPLTYDIESPLITLEGGANLRAVGTSQIDVSVVYWDNDV